MDIAQLYDAFEGNPLVTTDSRNCPCGSVFFALKGLTFNGNKFAKMALDNGCRFAVVDEKEYANDARCVLVDDALAAFKAFARHHRRQFRMPVIAITGTNGKTTTKELTAVVLSKRYNVLATQGNLNNDIGVPKTLLCIKEQHDIAVVEMGASHPGDIKTLAETAEPQYGLITNVGKAHLQGFGSLEGVVKTKGELYDFLRSHGGKVFIDGDNSLLTNMAEGISQIRYGTSVNKGSDVIGEVVDCSPLLTIRWKRTNGTEWNIVHSHLVGTYNIKNMLAAAAVGLHFGVDEQQINSAIECYEPGNSRSQLVVTEHNRLILDAYNANPSSMVEAISNFAAINSARKLAILGDMLELGDASSEEHQRIVNMLQESAIDNVWLVGGEFGKTNCAYHKFADVEQLQSYIANNKPEGFTVLIKGSNGVRLAGISALL